MESIPIGSIFSKNYDKPLKILGRAMCSVSFYRDMTHQEGVVVNVFLIFEGIKTGRWKDKVEKYRATGDSSIKESLPCYTVGGVFYPTKAIKDLKHPSNLLSIDIDDFEGSFEELMGNYLKPIIDSVVHVSKSAGGKGYSAVISIKDFKDYDHFRRIYEAIYSLLTEGGLGKVSKFDYLPNMNRLRFVSYDPDSFTNSKGVKPFTEEKEPPIKVTVPIKGSDSKKFDLRDRMTDSEKLDVVLSKYIEYAGEFGQRGTRHDWILGLARWSCRGDISESFLVNHCLANYQNSSRPNVWNVEVKRCIRDSYRAYGAERGQFEPKNSFKYTDILSSTNAEQVREQVWKAIAHKLNIAEKLEKEKQKKSDFLREEALFLKKIIQFI